MASLKKYVVLKFDSEVCGSYGTLEEAIETYYYLKNETCEPRILKLVTWTTKHEDITERDMKKS